MDDYLGRQYWIDPDSGLWAEASYSWCDRVCVLRGNLFVDDLTRAEFAAKYPNMVESQEYCGPQPTKTWG
jgi:hypothetical protein